MTESSATTTQIKAWLDNALSIRGKLETERAKLVSQIAEIDAALSTLGGEPKQGGKPNGHSKRAASPKAIAGMRRGNGTDGVSIRAGVLIAVAAQPGLDVDGLTIAVRKQRPGVKTVRSSVYNIATGMARSGEVRVEGDGGEQQFYPAALKAVAS